MIASSGSHLSATIVSVPQVGAELLQARRLHGPCVGHAGAYVIFSLAGKLLRHLAFGEVEAAALLTGAKDVAPGQRAVSLCTRRPAIRHRAD